jgi:hypothetical protein
MNFARICVLLTLSTAVCGRSLAGESSVAELLGRYSANQDKLNRSLIVRAECSSQVCTNDVFDANFGGPVEVRWDGKRGLYLANYHVKDRKELKGPLDETDAYRFTLWDGERRFVYYDVPPVPGRPVEAYADLSKRGSLNDVFTEQMSGTPLFGIHYRGRDRIDAVLRGYENLRVREQTEAVGPDGCYVIEASDAVSTWTVWLDPQHGYGIARASIHLGPGARNGERSWSGQEYSRYVLSDVEFREIDGVHVPMAYTQSEEFRAEEIGVRKATKRVKVTDVVLNADHEALGSFVPKMREGARVFDVDHGLTYYWRSGKLVPDIDEAAVKDMDTMVESLLAQGQTPAGIRAPEAVLPPKTDQAHDGNSSQGPASPVAASSTSGRSMQIIALIAIPLRTP